MPAFAAALRYADPVLSPDGRDVWCVREEHTDPSSLDRRHHPRDRRRPARRVCSRRRRPCVRVIVSGSQFLAFPTPSPDGGKLAWVAWNHPNMPWDATELRVGQLSGGVVDSWRKRARRCSTSPSLNRRGPTRDHIYAISDRSGWWNLYVVDTTGTAEPRR